MKTTEVEIQKVLQEYDKYLKECAVFRMEPDNKKFLFQALHRVVEVEKEENYDLSRLIKLEHFDTIKVYNPAIDEHIGNGEHWVVIEYVNQYPGRIEGRGRSILEALRNFENKRSGLLSNSEDKGDKNGR